MVLDMVLQPLIKVAESNRTILDLRFHLVHFRMSVRWTDASFTGSTFTKSEKISEDLMVFINQLTPL